MPSIGEVRDTQKAAPSDRCTRLKRAAPGTGSAAGESHIIGAGSSFAGPIIEAWGAGYVREHHVEVQYHSVGSGDGIRSVAAGSVDFAMTDVPLTQADLAKDERTDKDPWRIKTGDSLRRASENS